MKRTQGTVSQDHRRRRDAQEAIRTVRVSQVTTLPQLRELVQQLLEYLNIDYQG